VVLIKSLAMPRQLRIQYEGAIYHLLSRGDRWESIFADEKDCLRFLALLKESLRRYEVEIHAFLLCPITFTF